MELAFGAEQVSRTRQLPTLAMNQKQLSRFVKSINNFVFEANQSDADCKNHPVMVKISDASTAIEFSATQIAEELNRMPEVAFRLEVNYYCSSDDAPITNLSVELADYSRESVIRGFRIEQVDALSSLIDSQLVPDSKVLAGPTARIVVAFLLMILSLLCVVFLNYQLQKTWPSYLLLIVVPILFNAPKWLADFLPGFAVYSGEVSLIRRYSAEIGCYGLVVGMAISSTKWIWRFWKPFKEAPAAKPAKKSRDSSSGDEEQPADS
jgi:hypothetical protein